MKIEALGWNDFYADAFKDYAANGLIPARVICELRHAYALNTGKDELLGECKGRLLHKATARSELPAVGDWVAVRPRPKTPNRLDVLAVLPRKTKLSRRAAGENGHEQILAANLDTLFIVAALDLKLNPRRLERFLSVARSSGAEAIVVLNKADLHDNPQAAIEALRPITGDATVLALSAGTGRGCPQLRPWLKKGRTVALIGPSGVGKSTLVNRIMRDDVQFTQDVRDSDSKGRHTTTRRELFVTPSGALLIDTPGLREMQLWDAEIEEIFPDIADVALKCRFSNCSHTTEPDCAIRAALADQSLPTARWDSYNKLLLERAELHAHLASLPDRRAKIVWKKNKSVKELRARIDPKADHY